VKNDTKNSLSWRVRNRRPIEMVADKPSIVEHIKPNLINSRDDWIEKELNRRINRLEKGMDQAIKKKDTKDEDRIRLIKEENSDRKIISSESINNLKAT
jgi:hypothetical protein